MEISSELSAVLQNINRFRFGGNFNALQAERNKLIINDLVNLVIFDLQTTDSDEDSAIIQFCFYHPKTGRNLVKYVKSHKPITFKQSQLTGIYNSFSLYFDLPVYDKQCNPKILDEVFTVRFLNNSLLEREEIKDLAAKTRQLEPKLSEEEIANIAIEEVVNNLKLKSLDFELPIHELVEEIFEFIDRGIRYDESGKQITKTIFLSHKKLNEIILKAEMERMCCKDRLDDIIFLNVGDLFSDIVNKAIENSVINPNLVKGLNLEKATEIENILGENREDSYNAIINATNLWSSIEFCCKKLYGKNEWEFIVSKILEHLYFK